ncbi:hypothetical protein BLNAU_23864 [Blattamonas nauphoetae]|uniref:Uncharacterized protein n=1 Tax=Blattamonas nauphoetae TaxID=2049346 RepID=A0ABQ9WP04_9EUKA|nr:hypothetical protein BLNAU_23864 [Blattamonas nauphoetae]
MTALENVELPTDALPVDAVLRRAAASVYTLFDFPTLSLSHLPHHRTSIGQQPRSASAGRADKRPGCVYIVECVCAGRDGGIREEDERGGHKEYASDEKGAGRLQQTPSTSSKPQFISQTCISAVLLNSSPLTDLASIVAEVDANEVFMLHKTNMLEEIGAENELMERSCRNDGLDWDGRAARCGRGRRREAEGDRGEGRGGAAERGEEGARIEQSGRGDKRTGEKSERGTTPNFGRTPISHPTPLPSVSPPVLHHSSPLHTALLHLTPSTSSLVQYSSYLSPSRPISTNSLAPSALGPHTTRITETSWINTATVCSETMSDAWEGTKRNLKAMEEGDAQSSVATGQSEVAVSVEQAKKAREELEK